MRIALIAEHFVPLRSSCAVQMRDLARELRDHGHEVTFLVPAPRQREACVVEDFEGITIARLSAMESRDRAYAVRLLGELSMPYAMLRGWRSGPLRERRFDGIAWYSPNIFLGPLVAALKRASSCPSYLILRDIFPEWAADVGIIRRGAAFRLLQAVARHQYSVADTIGVQTPGNLPFFARQMARGKRVEVLQNWMRPAEAGSCSIDLSASKLRGRRIFAYAGNMGVAQGMEKLIALTRSLVEEQGIGFVFVGRGSEAHRLREEAHRSRNVEFYDEIPPDEISGLYSQCHAGLLTLDSRHRWHNIPGKFISYMHAGLPVLASVNLGNDLVDLIARERVGAVSTAAQGEDLPILARSLLAPDNDASALAGRCRKLAARMFSADAAARQIVSALSETAS